MRKVLGTVGWLVLLGGAAWAATSGLPVATQVSDYVTFLDTDVAYGLIAGGFAGVAYHFVTGRDTHHTLNYGLGAMAGGGILTQTPAMAAGLGISAGALIKLLA